MYDQVDVLILNPPSPDNFIYIRDINRHGRSSWERMIWPQTNLAILGAVAKQSGLSVKVLDCIGEKMSWDEFEIAVQQLKPRYCFSNLISVTFSNDVAALSTVKKASNAITIGMGPHVTNDPRGALAFSDDIDFVFVSEAEETFGELLEIFEEHKKPSLEILSSCKGLAFNSKKFGDLTVDEIVVTDERPFIVDLDTLPEPLYGDLPLRNYWAPFLGNYVFIEASRGCPYRCIFCRQGVMYNWKFRTKSGKRLAEEAIDLADRGVELVLFHGDTFTVNKKVVKELCETLIASGKQVKWACNTHAEPLKNQTELVSLMKQSGCQFMAIGIESGDDNILTLARKGTDAKTIESTVRLIANAGIEVWGYFIAGLPGETPETMKTTIAWAKGLPLKIAKFDIAAPYPGTEFNKMAVDEGWIDIENIEQFDQNASAIINYDQMSAKQIKYWAKRALIEYYSQPRMLWYVFKEAIKPKSMFNILLICRDFFALMNSKRSATDR
jgi:radical SAM superfamily enzyme YgiQ (UPF0313 family)